MHDSDVQDEKIDEDWINRFFRIVEDVSNQEMKYIWAKVLAGEIKRPKSFSLRTLDLIRNLTEDEAKTIMKVGNFAIHRGETTFLLRGHTNEVLRKFDLPHSDIALLIELGIILADLDAVITLHKNINVAACNFLIGKHIISVLRQPNAQTITVPIYSFTKPGREILTLIKIDPPFEYLNELARLSSDNAITVRYGEQVIENESKNLKKPFRDFFEVYSEYLKNNANRDKV
jgi:hypothetical protein